jgi:nicotinamide-nucleotide amidase
MPTMTPPRNKAPDVPVEGDAPGTHSPSPAACPGAAAGLAPADLEQLARTLRARGERLATAESCTGGWIAAACTDLAGSSDWFDRGFVTYANDAKVAMLGVPQTLIAQHGAVSQQVAEAMAVGARAAAGVAWGLAVTGIAGPGGAVPGKPVGTVWLAWAGPGGLLVSRCQHFQGERAEVRAQTVVESLQGLRACLDAAPTDADGQAGPSTTAPEDR